MLVVPLSYMALQSAALYLMRGRWLTAATLPAVAMAAALFVFIAGMALPVPGASLPLLVGLPVATLYLVALWLFFAIAYRRAPA